MAPPDLEVSLSLLETTAGSLSMLIEEFTNASDIESSYESAVGEKNLAGALHSFASNWKAHREDMIKSMQDVYKMATQSHQAYLDTDSKLAQDIKADTTSAPPGPAPHPSPGSRPTPPGGPR
jgi:uncharacterized protein DUF6507